MQRYCRRSLVKCGSCKAPTRARTTVVRVYARRWQNDFKYTLCDDCMVLLLELLRFNAESVNNRPFQFAEEVAG